MKRYVAILRGINVSGKRKVPMAELRALLEQKGFSEVKTYIQSGNVAFSVAEASKAPELEERMKQAIEDHFGYDVPVLIRSHEEMAETVQNNPFLLENPDWDITKLHVTFLGESPEPDQLAKLQGFESGQDRFIIEGLNVYLHCPGGYGNSKLTNKLFETKLKVRATTRNWKTVNKLLEMLS